MSETTPPGFVETDTPKARDIRAKGQRRYEERSANPEFLRDKSVVERMLDAREMIFGKLKNVRGEKAISPRSARVAAGELIFVDEVKTQERYYPAYIRLIDHLYDQVLQIQDPAQRGEAVIRLASVAYSLGIIVHPFIDGNGQTFRMVALSYLREFIPEMRNRTFPIRPETGMSASIDTNKVNNFPAPAEAIQDPELQRIVAIQNMITKAPTLSIEGVALTEQQQTWIVQANTVLPVGLRSSNPSVVLDNLEQFGQELRTTYEERAGIDVTLLIREEDFSPLRLEQYVEYLLLGQDSLRFHEDYILHGSEPIGPNTPLRIAVGGRENILGRIAIIQDMILKRPTLPVDEKTPLTEEHQRWVRHARAILPQEMQSDDPRMILRYLREQASALEDQDLAGTETEDKKRGNLFHLAALETYVRNYDNILSSLQPVSKR